ncbi:glycosyl hydrolase [Metarhizobium album]|uniref:Glycosyl hydrolase n=1 Tax=Metarhizobium album TaxID=2182425 RepID=A0A2U2DTA2_9HYPH|nr:GH25 family lysozyme [Rhizobium album]PWE56517.1 glycosyl hydrolase [Rhizobium album]
MRLSTVPALFLTCLSLSACASSSGPDALSAGLTSPETTSSVTGIVAPVPVADVGTGGVETTTAEARPEQNREALAWAGQVPSSDVFVPERSLSMPVPGEKPVEQVAMITPAIDPLPGKRSRVYGHRFRDAKPINFGSRSPRKMAVHGVDVSRWQGDIDWAKLRTQGANFAYIKSTDGGDHLDPMFRTNWRKAKEAGLKRGAYHFFYWCRTGAEQADWFIRNVPRDPDALPPVIDVEWNGESRCKRRPSPETVREKMQVFMDKLERHYGKRPVIYTAPDFYKDNLRGAFTNYPFWLRAVAQHPSKVYPGRKWVFWQYSGSGLSHGVEGKIDLNVFHGSVEEWHAWLEGRQS